MRLSNLRRSFLFGTALAVTAVLGTSSPARANLQIRITVDGNPTQTFSVASGGTAFTETVPGSGIPGAFTIGGVTINGNATSDSPGSPTQAQLLGSTVKLTINDSAAHTITVSIGDTGFTQPLPGGVFTSQLGGTDFTAFTGLSATPLTFQSYVDPLNGQNTTSLLTPGLQDTFKTGNLGTVGSFALEDGTTHLSGLSSPPGFSITSIYTLTIAAGNSGGSLNLTTSATLSPTPEPGTFALAAAGLPVLGLIWVRRRRQS